MEPSITAVTSINLRLANYERRLVQLEYRVEALEMLKASSEEEQSNSITSLNPQKRTYSKDQILAIGEKVAREKESLSFNVLKRTSLASLSKGTLSVDKDEKAKQTPFNHRKVVRTNSMSREFGKAVKQSLKLEEAAKINTKINPSKVSTQEFPSDGTLASIGPRAVIQHGLIVQMPDSDNEKP